MPRGIAHRRHAAEGEEVLEHNWPQVDIAERLYASVNLAHVDNVGVEGRRYPVDELGVVPNSRDVDDVLQL